MPSIKLIPASDYVLVLDQQRGTQISDIELPDNSRQQEMAFGTVVAVGNSAQNTQEQDHICYGPYAGKTVVMNQVEFRLLREGQIEAYLVTELVADLVTDVVIEH